MKTIVVCTQSELDALPSSFSDYTVIEIRSAPEIWISTAKDRGSSHVEAWDSSHVEAWGSSHVVARGSSHVVARGSSHVVAWGSSHVEAWGSSHVVAWDSSHVIAWDSSHVVAWDSSHVEAWGSSHVEARGSSHVEAWGSSHVVAWGSSHVIAWDSSHVVAWDSSHVEARGSSHVEARGSSHVEARGSSHVEARGNVAVHVQSSLSIVDLFGFACAFLLAAAKCKKRSKTATIIKPKIAAGAQGWLDREGADSILFKRVSNEFRTQENTSNETLWQIGSTVEHPAWQPKERECGGGKFHGCSRPYFCDEFRSTAGDRYVAIRVFKKDMYAWPNASYPHKIGFRKGTVLYECDRYGKRKIA